MVVFYLMTGKGYSVLNWLIQYNKQHFISYIVSARDGNVLNDYYEDIRQRCSSHNIVFYDRTDAPVNNQNYSIAISWKWLIMDDKLIVLHDSLLPKYRGFSPLVTALVNGDSEVGVTALFADARYDTGDIISQQSIKINYPAKIGKVIETISSVYIDLVDEVLQKIINNQLNTTPQDEELATYSLWRDEDDYKINWNESSMIIKRFIDAIGYPYKGAACQMGTKKVRVYDAALYKDVVVVNRVPGKVIFKENGLPIVVCGSGLLKITEMKFEDGTNALPLNSFRVRFK